MKKILSSKSGMTLMEVTAAMLILAVFCIMVSATISPVLRHFALSNELSELSLLVDNVSDEISNTVSMAKVVKDSGDGGIICEMNDGYTVTYKMKDSILQVSFDKINYSPIYDEKYYKNKRLAMEIVDSSTPLVDPLTSVVKMRLRIIDNKGAPMTEREISAHPMVLTN